MSRLTALAYSIVYLLALPVIVFRLIRAPGRALLGQRFGFGLHASGARSVWLHASSVGEVALLEPIVAELQNRFPGIVLLITAFTATGISTARQRFPQHQVRAFPFDFGFCVERFLRHFDPRIAIIVESEFWPGFLRGLNRWNVPVVALNVRMSERSAAIHLRTRFVAEALRSVAVIAVQDEANAARFRKLGVDAERVHVTGNMKYDLVSPVDRVPTRSELGIAAGAFVIVGGSLHDREDEAFLDAVFSPVPAASDATAIIAPRYPSDAGKVLASAKARGLRGILKSRLGADGARSSAYDVCVVDTLGELRRLYALADIAFVGGSLYFRGATKGGHNLMEPAICAVPVVFGPYNHSFADIARELVAQKGGFQVRNSAELREILTRLHLDSELASSVGEAARRVVLSGQGATRRNLSLVVAQLERGSH